MDSDELRDIPVFKNLTDQQRARIAGRLKEVSEDLGAVIARQGDFAYHLFVVQEGMAVVTVDDEFVAELGPGSTFGEIGVIERGRRSASVVAVTPMRLLTMTVWDFNDLCDDMPEFAAHARAVARQRLEGPRRGLASEPGPE